MGTRMYVDACFAVGHFTDDAWDEGHAEQQKFMGDAVAADGFDDRVAADDFAVRLGCGVAIVGCFYVCGEDVAQFRQSFDELCGDVLCFFGQLVCLNFFAGLETKSGKNLLGEQVSESVYADAYVIG